ncbi:MAG: hypothetical protein MUO54_11470, partial [Anaerolineales bacterium]|nr:hypothetical protein [Anaerolineales bacterium]
QGKYSDVMMRYNIFAGNLEFKQNNTVYILDPNPRIMRKVELGDLTLVVDQIETSLPPGLFVLLDSGKITLLLKKAILFREKQEPRAIETTGKPAKYATAPDIMYTRIGNEKLTKVTNLKKMIASFPDHNEEMMQFAKENKISSNKPDEIKLLVSTYNAYK